MNTSSDRIYARYWIETAFPLVQVTATMAGEQSTGTFLRVPGETDELRELYAARVEVIEEQAPASSPSLPGSGVPSNWDGIRRTAEVTLSWPLHNIGPSLPNLLATIAGNLSELKAFSGLKLLDIILPADFLSVYQGPQFGISGTRASTGVYDRPLIGTIIKPSLGMSPEATAAQVKALAEAGIDFIKDDELQTDGPHCPFVERITAVQRVLNRHCDRTGKRIMYAANITGDLDQMLSRHDHVLVNEGTCIMVSMNSIGLPAMKALRAHSQLVIHGHRNGWGMLGRSSGSACPSSRSRNSGVSRASTIPMSTASATNSASQMSPLSPPPAPASHRCSRRPLLGAKSCRSSLQANPHVRRPTPSKPSAQPTSSMRVAAAFSAIPWVSPLVFAVCSKHGRQQCRTFRSSLTPTPTQS